ncbi:hypothetical protein OW492_09585 [Psychromonas sp. 14N.309.X.WAT.B.A12]|uniref:hypothetical protein n=1 Tax=Psychromonas sp. 14N.309.X.WAT.B.A12 TaxID=2998322 RepID=UPI0025B20C1B|nr:hypothetical protein [Psychromonas sp. 14N.309.X.WAT.B.A12]MDN2663630.1 hypothetical protein [Psychromonas sp. 14N.309.X.WAT.B.A12]
MELVNQILSWPTIVQGVIGSAIFWFILFFGQKLTKHTESIWGKHKHEIATRDQLITQAINSKNLVTLSSTLSLGTYMGVHYIVKAFIFITLGLSLQSLLPIFSVIGYLGGVIYLFLALRSCPHLSVYDKK